MSVKSIYRVVVIVCAAIVTAGLVATAESGADDAVQKSKNAILGERVAELTKALALACSEADSLRARLARYEERASVPELRPTILRRGLPGVLKVLDVNDKLGMIVVAAGAENGVEYGMEFTVVRNETQVARTRVIDVRRSVAGLLVEDAKSRLFPEVGDKCIRIRRTRI